MRLGSLYRPAAEDRPCPPLSTAAGRWGPGTGSLLAVEPFHRQRDGVSAGLHRGLQARSLEVVVLLGQPLRGHGAALAAGGRTMLEDGHVVIAHLGPVALLARPQGEMPALVDLAARG